MIKPLEEFRLFETSDTDEAREVVSRVYCDHVLAPTKNSQLKACHNRVQLLDISLNYLQYGAEVKVEPGYLDDFFLFQLPIAGSAQIIVDDLEFSSSDKIASVINPSEYTKMRWDRDCKKLMVQIKRDALEQSLSRILGRPICKPIIFSHQVKHLDNHHAVIWWRQIKHLIEDIDHGFDPWRSRALLDDLHRSLLTNVLYSFSHNYQQSLSGQSTNIRPRQLKEIEAYIAANLDHPISIDDLVELSGVSARSIYFWFNNFRGTTPMRYILQARLDKVHCALSEPNQSQSVTEIANHSNFSQLGRFSAAYKRVYGESPSTTLRK
ncbi:MAG: hypothetical protein OFPI_06460 [Osedax symbiont Rs2]|nr:MAG: hypothetical protein OFPI_06460 [Osedax symbiont Rs2]